jgi:hypothetical protein
MTKPGAGNGYYRMNGAGEMLVFSAADFEDFLEPRPDLPASMEAELKLVVETLVANRWPFRLHATYNESITRMLDVFEAVNRDIPFDGLHQRRSPTRACLAREVRHPATPSCGRHPAPCAAVPRQTQHRGFHVPALSRRADDRRSRREERDR